MAKQPTARFSSAGELARAATAAALGDQAPAAWSDREPTPAAVPPSEPPSTRPFSSAYPNPADTSSSPYPPLPAPAIPARRPALGRAPVVLGTGSFYYRGERIRDSANIELANAERSSGGFDLTNPANGARYEVGPKRLRIISNGHVDSSERVLQYAAAS
jgi:hypothetical protein